MRTRISNLPEKCSLVIDIKPRHNTLTVKAQKGEQQQTIIEHVKLPGAISTSIDTTSEELVVQIISRPARWGTLTFNFADGTVCLKQAHETTVFRLGSN